MWRGDDTAAAVGAGRAHVARRGCPLHFVILAVAVACADNFADPDLWRHLFTGSAILHSALLPTRDIYSYSAMGMPVRIHEWLADAIFALAYGWFGVPGLKAIKLVCATIALGALNYGMARTAASSRIQRMVLLLVAAGLAPQMQFRPQLFTFALLSIEMAMLTVVVFEESISLWPLIPIFALWANLHGGFVVGLGALGLAGGVLTVQQFVAGRSPRRGVMLLAVGLLCAAATTLNPFGLEIWRNVFHSVSDPLLRHIINDWASLPHTLWLQWSGSRSDLLQFAVPIVLFVAFFYSIASAPSLDDAPVAAIGVLLVISGIDVVRNIALGVIALTIPLAHHLGLRASSNANNAPASPEISPWLIGSLAAMVAIVGGSFSPWLVTWAPVPGDAIAFMERHDLHGNILNEFEWGDYLIWHLTPQSRVFIDGRAELLYPDSLLKEYAQFYYALPGATDILERYRHDFVLLRPATRACRIVEKDARWKLIYQDSIAKLFAPAAIAVAIAPQETQHSRDSRDYFP